MRPLRILIVEDNSQDAELLLERLRCAGFDPEWSRVDNETGYRARLCSDLDVILSDYAMPEFSGCRALQILRERGLEIPFIMVSGTIGEDAAVAIMQEGAADYVMKDRLTRLGLAVEHALEKGRLRRESKEKRQGLGLFRNLMDQSNDIIEVVDPESGRFLDVNERGCLELGYSRAEYLSLRVFDIDPLVKEADWPGELERIRANGSLRKYELYRRRKDGTAFPIEINARWVRLDRDYIVTVVRDITERKVRERKIQEQARLLDLASDAISVHDLEDRAEYWNHGAERLFGWSAADILGANVKSLLYTDPDTYGAAKAAVLRDGQWHGDLALRAKDGREILANARWTLVRDETGRPKAVLVIETDITEQKSLEQRLLRTQRLESIGTLASGVAHDLNNILSPILMAAPLLRDPLPLATQELLVSTIETCAQRGVDIVRQVLTFARGTEGQRKPLQPMHLITEMERIALETFPKNIEIRNGVKSALANVQGDATQIHQILLNLCVNARDAMPDGGTLTISGQNFEIDENYAAMVPGASAGSYVQLAVSDTGVGIPKAVLENIFDPFFTTKDPGHGTGLGLSNVMGIVKSHGGFLDVYTEVGNGTTFRVYFPVATGEQPVDTAEITQPSGNGEKLLLVDDEADIRKVTEMVLRKSGYELITAGDGAEALAIYAQRGHEISAVLTDLMMPLMDGFALIRALRRLNPRVRIIASTGHCEDARREELKSRGVEAVMSKPYNTASLLKTIHEVITAPHRLCPLEHP